MGLLDWLTGPSRPEAQLPVDAAPAPAPTAADLEAALQDVEAMVADGRVPAVVSARVRRITRSVRETLPRIGNLGLGSLDSFSVIATATDYLPEAIGAYIRLPRDWADSRPIENGKTSLLLLVDQLDLLGGTMDKIRDAVNRTDAEALITHGRFLRQRFGHAADADALPPVEASVPPPRSATANPLDLD